MSASSRGPILSQPSFSEHNHMTSYSSACSLTCQYEPCFFITRFCFENLHLGGRLSVSLDPRTTVQAITSQSHWVWCQWAHALRQRQFSALHTRVLIQSKQLCCLSWESDSDLVALLQCFFPKAMRAFTALVFEISSLCPPLLLFFLGLWTRDVYRP